MTGDPGRGTRTGQSRANIMREALVENTRYGILVFDADERVVLANRSAEQIYEKTRDELVGLHASVRLFPGEALIVSTGSGHLSG